MIERFPVGWSQALFGGRRYGVTVSEQVGGRSRKIYAEELGGRDVISANIYLVDDQEVLRPCEMSSSKVLEFVRDAEIVSASVEADVGVERGLGDVLDSGETE